MRTSYRHGYEDAPTADEIRAAVDLAKQLRAERDKPAARVVKLPKMQFPSGSDGFFYCHRRDEQWRAALKDAGFTVADEGEDRK